MRTRQYRWLFFLGLIAALALLLASLANRRVANGPGIVISFSGYTNPPNTTTRFALFSISNEAPFTIRWRGNWVEVEGSPYNKAPIVNPSLPFFAAPTLGKESALMVGIGEPLDEGRWRLDVLWSHYNLQARLLDFVFKHKLRTGIGPISWVDAQQVLNRTNYITNSSIWLNKPAPSTATATPQRIASTGIENLFVLGDGLYSGGEPSGETAFAQLEKLGVKTILSVDGSKPDLETAHRHGIRYAHLPLGYDGYESNACLRLSKAAEALLKPLFVHCHHGQHRGPTAAALIAMSVSGWTPEWAEGWLRLAGTSTNYPGLYQTVRSFRPPATSVLAKVSPEFPEVASTPGLVEAMVDIDRAWEHLKTLERLGFQTSPEDPDLVPAREASRIVERLMDVPRLADSRKYGGSFAERLSNATTRARELTAQLNLMKTEQKPNPEVSRTQKLLGQTCVDCHSVFRDRMRPD